MDKSRSFSFKNDKLKSAQKISRQNAISDLELEAFKQRVETGLSLMSEIDMISAEMDSILTTSEAQSSSSNRSWSTIGLLKSRLRNDGQSSTPKRELT